MRFVVSKRAFVSVGFLVRACLPKASGRPVSSSMSWRVGGRTRTSEAMKSADETHSCCRPHRAWQPDQHRAHPTVTHSHTRRNSHRPPLSPPLHSFTASLFISHSLSPLHPPHRQPCPPRRSNSPSRILATQTAALNSTVRPPPSSLLPSLSPHSQADPTHRAARRRRSGHVRRLPERLDHESAVEAEPEPRVRTSRPSSSSLRATWSRSARRCAS